MIPLILLLAIAAPAPFPRPHAGPAPIVRLIGPCPVPNRAMEGWHGGPWRERPQRQAKWYRIDGRPGWWCDDPDCMYCRITVYGERKK